MNNILGKKIAAVCVFGLAAGISGLAHAIDLNLTGFIRQEGALNVNNEENIFNQTGNAFDGKTVTNVVTGEQIMRPIAKGDTTWRYMATRAELDLQLNFNQHWTGQIKVRGIYDWSSQLEDDADFDRPEYFEVPFFRGDSATYLETNGSDWMVDFPSLYLDYTNGPLWLRAGNQQIAWGEALFFRVADVPNGLDLRRHLILDWAGEEYADERVPSPAVRGSYTFDQKWELEAFAQMFSPSIYPNSNTSYNVIASQFVVNQREGFKDAEGEVNGGIRLRGQLGELGMQAFVVNRMNPDGVFRWTESNQDVCLAPNAAGGCDLNLGDTPFEAFSGIGVYSSREWFGTAANARLDGVGAVAAAAEDFPAAGAAISNTLDTLGIDNGNGFVDTREEAAAVLDAFFSPTIGLGDLRGHITREYHRETVVGAGFNYVFFDDDGSWLDQLILRFEASYTKDRKFTDIRLSRNPIEEDEWVASLVLEKWHRFTEDFPGTFLVFEYMYKSESDLFGRHLSGLDNDGEPNGEDGFHALAFALQQPFPNLIWRFDLAVLVDVNGGVLVQPGLRWKPSKEWTLELYGTYLGSGDGNKDIIETVDWSDEVSFRLSYQF